MNDTASPREAATTNQGDVFIIVVKSDPTWTTSAKKRVRAAAFGLDRYGLRAVDIKQRKRKGGK